MTSENNSPEDEAAAGPEAGSVGADSAPIDTDAPADEASVVAPASDAPASDVAAPARRKRHWPAAFFAATGAAALAGAVACLGYFGYTGLNAYFGDAGKVAELRDESVDVAEQAVLNISTVNVKDLDAWQRRVAESLTGDALKQANEGAVADLKKRVQNNKIQAEITAKVTALGATSVNLDSDSADVLVFAVSTAKDLTGKTQPQSAPMSYLVTVINVDGTRKASVIRPLTGVTAVEDLGGGSAGGQSGSGAAKDGAAENGGAQAPEEGER